MNNLQQEHAIQALQIVVNNANQLYDAATESRRKKLEDGLNNVQVILDACGIDTPQELWIELEVWKDVPTDRLAIYVEDNLKMVERMREECDNVYNTLLRAKRLLDDLPEFPGFDEAVVTGYQDAR